MAYKVDCRIRKDNRQWIIAVFYLLPLHFYFGPVFYFFVAQHMG